MIASRRLAPFVLAASFTFGCSTCSEKSASESAPPDVVTPKAAAPEAVAPPPPVPKGPKVIAKGTIAIGETIKKPLAGALFVVGRMAIGEGVGPVIFSKRFDAPQFPVAYELTERDSIIIGKNYPASLFIEARFDQDGELGTRSTGDLHGIHREIVLMTNDGPPPQIDVALSRVIEETPPVAEED